MRVWVRSPGKTQRTEELLDEGKGYLERIMEEGHEEYQLLQKPKQQCRFFPQEERPTGTTELSTNVYEEADRVAHRMNCHELGNAPPKYTFRKGPVPPSRIAISTHHSATILMETASLPKVLPP